MLIIVSQITRWRLQMSDHHIETQRFKLQWDETETREHLALLLEEFKRLIDYQKALQIIFLSDWSIPLRVVKWKHHPSLRLSLATSWADKRADGRQPAPPQQLPQVSSAHTTLRHSSDHKTSRSSSASASTVAQSMKTQPKLSIGFKTARGPDALNRLGLQNKASCLQTWPGNHQRSRIK